MAADTASLGAILLAAGESSRLGRSKQLLEVGGEPLVIRQSKRLLALGPAAVVVVTGADGDKVAGLLADMPVQRAHNPEWRLGMGKSLACGVLAMPERVRAALVLLCDQWKVTGEDLGRLVETWSRNPLAAVVSDYGAVIGPPAILPRAMFERLARLQGGTGARRILKNWKGTVLRVPMASAATDLDTSADLPGRG